MNMNMNKMNTGKLLAAVMAFAMVITCAAVLMSDNGVQAAEAEQGYYGDVNTYQPFPEGTNIVIVDDTEVGEGGIIYVQGNFRVAEGVTLTVKDGGQLIIAAGSEGAPKVTIDGAVEISGSGDFNNTTIPQDVQDIVGLTKGVGTDVKSAFIVQGENSQGTTADFKNSGITINSSVTVTSGAVFKSTDSTYGSVLIANGGNLSIAEKSKKAASITGMTVYVAVGGTFKYAGTTDSTDGVTISSYGTGTNGNVTTSSVNLKAAATAPAKADHSNLTFTTTSSNINGYAAGSEDPVMFREYALNINGTVSYAETMTLSANAVSTYYTSIDAAKHAGDATHTESVVAYNDLIMGKIIIDKLTVDDAAKLTIGVDTKPVYVIVNGALDVKEITENDYAEITTGTGNSSKNIQPNMVKIYAESVLEIVGTVSVNYEMIEGTVSTAGVIAVNGGTAAVADYDETDKVQLYGAFYVDADEVLHLSDLATAIAGAQTAGAEQVSVYAATNSEKCVDGYGGYAITADLTIPDGIELFIGNALVVDEGATVTFSADSDIGFETGWGKFFVFGTVVDNSLNLADVDAPAENMMYFQVKTVSEDEEVNTYTTLANALETTTSGTIYLYNSVEVSGTMIIPENVTVAFSEDADANGKITLEENATLIINGTLQIDKLQRLSDDEGTITVNNVLVSKEPITVGNNLKNIYGVYFSADLDDDGTPENYITSAAYAAENSASVSGSMTVYGKVAMGTVTFTKGDDASSLAVVIKNNYATTTSGTTVDKNVTTGDITLAGGATFNATGGGFTGTVTDGTNTVNLNKSKGASIGFKTVESTDGTSTDMILTGANILGGITVSAGEVTIDSEMKFSNDKDFVGTLAVAQNAVLNVNKLVTLSANAPALTTSSLPESISGFINDNKNFDVAGTVNVNQGGNLKWGYTVITGTLNVLKGGNLDMTAVLNDGTISVAEDAQTTVGVEVMILNGTLSGPMGINELTASIGGAIFAMPGSDVTAAKIMWDSTNAVTQAETSEVYINGELYATVYANGSVPILYVAQTADVDGVYKTGEKNVRFFTDAAMDNEFSYTDAGTKLIGANDAYYITMAPMIAEGTISQGTGLALYIDNIGIESYLDGELTVGTHTVRYDVKAGYDGANATITFNGQAVENGGTITITTDMVKDGFTLVASGAVPADYASGSSSDGMGLTEILLVILVILIVVMAIMVALRLMRS